ncbi:uncharacterized protein LOC111267811 [Varroa jacobsoni]|uniref:Uncharacterized protein n=1 Tax=Varroa destructor TaxID=109461 RepID=A0A7M7J5M2_VARDE|nr:uncharacterized protein LOC111244386 [Varroa destructor]XP_022647171.1 uncharacterized protein LOC111244386 [Varroa destructor]XP_022702064.1 uncharacterized protein LOC111267811 [Varroa jacobsoni]XP_022702065.1 uncharacterized protein LOC111267811 [Varroa jacobsoni]
MTPRKTVSTKKKSGEKTSTSSGRKVLQRTSISVASIKEKTRQGLKRLTNKGGIQKRTVHKSPAKILKENISANSRKTNTSIKSPAIKVFRPRSDENYTPQRQQPSRKVKTCKGPKQQYESEFEKRRIPVSVSSALQEMKGNISKALETVSTKLKINRGERRSIRQSAYDPLLSSDTPVKLYSPFTIGDFEHTPTGERSSEHSAKRNGRVQTASTSNRTTPRNRGGKIQSVKHGANVSRNLLDTPTGKFRQDLEDMTKGFKELTSLAKRLNDRVQQE